MIALDTSAVMAVMLDDVGAPELMEAMVTEDCAMSAGTYTELLVTALNRGIAELVTHFVTDLGVQIVPVDTEAALQVKDAFQAWGRGRHAAGLNFADCFAYALAKNLDVPILCVGSHFGKTDAQIYRAPSEA